VGTASEKRSPDVNRHEFLPISIVFSERFLEHDPGKDHPELPARISTVLDVLKEGPLAKAITFYEPVPCTWEDMLMVHQEEYLFRFEERVLKGRQFLDHPDNRLSYSIYQVAMLAAGAGIKAIDLLEAQISNRIKIAPPFCLVRPPGHHADPTHALGFCFLNNAAIAARYWQKRYGRKKIIIFDFDAHHGNGIQDTFYQDPDVYYISIHEDPILSFPGTGFREETGEGAGKGRNLNIPLMAGGIEKEIIKILDQEITPEIETFAPDAMIIAAGFDAHRMDDMSGLQFRTSTYGRIGQYIRIWSEQYCSARTISILEGGYSLEVLGPSVERYLGALSIKLD